MQLDNIRPRTGTQVFAFRLYEALLDETNGGASVWEAKSPKPTQKLDIDRVYSLAQKLDGYTRSVTANSLVALEMAGVLIPHGKVSHDPKKETGWQAGGYTVLDESLHALPRVKELADLGRRVAVTSASRAQTNEKLQADLDQTREELARVRERLRIQEEAAKQSSPSGLSFIGDLSMPELAAVKAEVSFREAELWEKAAAENDGTGAHAVVYQKSPRVVKKFLVPSKEASS